MRMDPAVFYNMSLREWVLKQRGFFEYERHRMQGEWERARWTSFWVLKSQTGKKWPHKPVDIVKFDWEKTEEETTDWVMSNDDMDYLSRKMGKFTDSKGNFFNA